jgi:hypothetical protein
MLTRYERKLAWQYYSLYPVGKFERICELINKKCVGKGAVDIEYVCEQWLLYLKWHEKQRRKPKLLMFEEFIHFEKYKQTWDGDEVNVKLTGFDEWEQMAILFVQIANEIEKTCLEEER